MINRRNFLTNLPAAVAALGAVAARRQAVDTGDNAETGKPQAVVLQIDNPVFDRAFLRDHLIPAINDAAEAGISIETSVVS